MYTTHPISYLRPSDKAQRQELRKELQQEFRGMLQKRMSNLLQVSKKKIDKKSVELSLIHFSKFIKNIVQAQNLPK